MSYKAPHATPGYGTIVPVILGIASIGFFLTCVPLLGRNDGFAPMDPALHARVIGYVGAIEVYDESLLQVRLHRDEKPLGIVVARDDRPWRSFTHGEHVRLLLRTVHTPRGDTELEYIVDDAGAKWGGVIARATAAVLCDLAAIAGFLLARRRPSAATRYPPPVPRSASVK